MKLLAAIAAGGAAGAVARYLVTVALGHALGTAFPYGTLAVNVIGSFLLGALIATMGLTWSASEAVRALLVVGVLGSFTTFSAFSMDTWYLFERGEMLRAAAYVCASVALSLGGIVAGLWLLRRLLA